MRHLFTFGSLVALALTMTACSTAPATSTGGSTPPKDGQCHADNVQWAVGQENTEAVGKRIWKESGAGLIRPIGPNQAVTMDFRADRVNVSIDKDNRITRVTCG